MQPQMSEESHEVKVYFTDGSLSERWEATIDDETHELTLWDPEGNELWKPEHLQAQNIQKVIVKNTFTFQLTDKTGAQADSLACVTSHPPSVLSTYDAASFYDLYTPGAGALYTYHHRFAHL